MPIYVVTTRPNKLIRYFIPKGTRLENFSHSDIKVLSVGLTTTIEGFLGLKHQIKSSLLSFPILGQLNLQFTNSRGLAKFWLVTFVM